MGRDQVDPEREDLKEETGEVEVEVERRTENFFFWLLFILLPLLLPLCSLLSRFREATKTVRNIILGLLLMRPVAAARSAASSSSSSLGRWAALPSSRRRSAVAAATTALLHSSSFSPAPRQRSSRALSQPARAGARDAAMRELMASRDDARADKLSSKAPLGELDLERERCFFVVVVGRSRKTSAAFLFSPSLPHPLNQSLSKTTKTTTPTHSDQDRVAVTLVNHPVSRPAPPRRQRPSRRL